MLRHRLAAFLWLVLLIGLTPGVAAADEPGPVLPPEASTYFLSLLPPSELTKSLDIEIIYDHALFRFTRERAVVEIEARDPSTCAKPAGPLCLRLVTARGPGAEALAAVASDALDRAAREAKEGSPWVAPSTPSGPTDKAHRGGPKHEPVWPVVGEGFILLVLVGVLIALWRRRRILASPAAALPGALAMGALVLRFAAHPVPSDIRDVIGTGVFLQERRAGWSCFLHLLFSVLPATHESVWNLNRVFGALAVPLLYVVMRRRFTALAATAAAAALAVTPLVVRFSASDTPYVPLCAAFFGAVVALDHFASSGSRAALALGLGLLTCAMQLRPDGPWLIVPAAILFACHPIDLRSTARPSVLGLGAAFLAINVPFSWWAFTGHKDSAALAPANFERFVGVGSLFGSPWVDLNMSPWPMSLLVAAGVVAAVLARRPGLLWLIATLVAFPFKESAVAQFAHARYHLPAVHLACGLAGLAVAELVRLAARARPSPLPAPVAVAIAVFLPVAAALPRMDLLTRMWTPQLEFERLRAGLRALGERCRVVTLMQSNDAGFVPFTDPSAADFLDLEEYLVAPPQEGCLVYYRAASCLSPDAITATPPLDGDHCRAFEERVRPTPISEWSVPAIPYLGERYPRDPIAVGLYRIGPRNGR